MSYFGVGRGGSAKFSHSLNFQNFFYFDGTPNTGRFLNPIINGKPIQIKELYWIQLLQLMANTKQYKQASLLNIIPLFPNIFCETQLSKMLHKEVTRQLGFMYEQAQQELQRRIHYMDFGDTPAFLEHWNYLCSTIFEWRWSFSQSILCMCKYLDIMPNPRQMLSSQVLGLSLHFASSSLGVYTFSHYLPSIFLKCWALSQAYKGLHSCFHFG